jgi:ferredoxin
VDGSGGAEALEAVRRGAATANRRGACSHPDGVVRFALSALEVFTEDLAAHIFQSKCGRPVQGILPLPAGPEVKEQKTLTVDWVRCEGHGLCAHLVPELIHLDSQGFPVIMSIAVPPWLEKEAAQAVNMCPALALRLTASPKQGGGGGGKPGPIPVAAPERRVGLVGGGGRPALTAGPR